MAHFLLSFFFLRLNNITNLYYDINLSIRFSRIEFRSVMLLKKKDNECKLFPEILKSHWSMFQVKKRNIKKFYFDSTIILI